MKVHIAVSAEDGDPGPGIFFHQDVLRPFVSSLFDQVWPEWKDQGDVQISVALVGKDEIRDLNRTYRDTDSPTDVLSFPQWEENGVFCPPKDWDVLPLGDVVICPDAVRENALDKSVPFKDEMALVFFHSLLHLLGWDHDTEEKEKAMWSIQESYRDKLMNHLNKALLLESQEG